MKSGKNIWSYGMPGKIMKKAETRADIHHAFHKGEIKPCKKVQSGRRFV